MSWRLTAPQSRTYAEKAYADGSVSIFSIMAKRMSEKNIENMAGQGTGRWAVCISVCAVWTAGR